MTPTAKKVLEAIQDITQKTAGAPGIAAVAEKIKLPRSTVFNVVHALMEAGLIRRRKRWSHGLVLRDRCPECGRSLRNGKK